MNEGEYGFDFGADGYCNNQSLFSVGKEILTFNIFLNGSVSDEFNDGDWSDLLSCVSSSASEAELGASQQETSDVGDTQAGNESFQSNNLSRTSLENSKKRKGQQPSNGPRKHSAPSRSNSQAQVPNPEGTKQTALWNFMETIALDILSSLCAPRGSGQDNVTTIETQSDIPCVAESYFPDLVRAYNEGSVQKLKLAIERMCDPSCVYRSYNVGAQANAFLSTFSMPQPGSSTSAKPRKSRKQISPVVTNSESVPPPPPPFNDNMIGDKLIYHANGGLVRLFTAIQESCPDGVMNIPQSALRQLKVGDEFRCCVVVRYIHSGVFKS